MEKKNLSKLTLALCLAVCMGFAASEILKSDPLVRLIPADVLRGNSLEFRQMVNVNLGASIATTFVYEFSRPNCTTLTRNCHFRIFCQFNAPKIC